MVWTFMSRRLFDISQAMPRSASIPTNSLLIHNSPLGYDWETALGRLVAAPYQRMRIRSIDMRSDGHGMVLRG